MLPHLASTRYSRRTVTALSVNLSKGLIQIRTVQMEQHAEKTANRDRRSDGNDRES